MTAAIAAGAILSGPTAAAQIPSGSLSPAVATAFVDAQARALCVVESKAYPTLAALQAAYVQAERSTKLSAHQLTQARAAATRSLALRTRISKRLAATCRKRR